MLQVEQMEEVERAFVHVDYMRRWARILSALRFLQQQCNR
jgi:hypothetical protein